MAYSKVVHNNETLIDLTQDTINQNALLSTYTAHDCSGNIIQGTVTLPSIYQDTNGYIILDDEGSTTIDYLDLRARNQTVYEYENTSIVTLSGIYMLQGWSNLARLSLPNLTTMTGAFVFGNNNNANLEVYLPNLTTGNSQALQTFDCKVLVLPSITGIPNYFLHSGNITTVDLGKNCTNISGSYSLNAGESTIILRCPTVVTLANTNDLPSSIFGSNGTGGTIYVPSDLISSYQSATNWSTINGYGTITWIAIEGSQYEYHYADGTEVTS